MLRRLIDFGMWSSSLRWVLLFQILSGLTYVIVKPCGLTTAEGGQKELIVAHDDMMTVLPNSIAWADVACVLWWLFRAQACALTCAPRLVCRHQITAKCSMKRGFRAVRYTEAREKLSHFFVELCAFISGIFTITGLFNNLLHRSIVHAAKKARWGQARLKARCARLPSGRTEQHQHRASWSLPGDVLADRSRERHCRNSCRGGSSS